MNTLALVVLSQLAAPLVPAQQVEAPDLVDIAPKKGSLHWVIDTPIMAAFAGAAAGGLTAASLPGQNGDGRLYTGALVGSAIGAGLGLVAGYFAREGSVVGKIGSITLWVLGSGALTGAAGLGAAFGFMDTIGLKLTALALAASVTPAPMGPY
jgi:hypothetical protein